MKNAIINLSIIVPVYNEENTLLKILTKLNILNDYCNLEVIVINDGSTDSTKEIIDTNPSLYTKSIHLSSNYGKGKAVIEGLKCSSLEYVLVQDADLEYDPEDLIEFIKQIEKHNFDLILGSRFIGNRRTVLNFWHMVGNKFITFLFNIINNTTFSDIYCCYCMFKRQEIIIDELRCFGWVNKLKY